MRRRLIAAATGLLIAASLAVAPRAAATPAAPRSPASATLTNLAHLDFLTDTVDPAGPARTHHLPAGREPAVGVLWVYADHQPDGSFQRVGGGDYDPPRTPTARAPTTPTTSPAPPSSTCGTGGSSATRTAATQAYQLLRGLTYLQTASGPNAGNVVLWMQPDGTLNPSADPAETARTRPTPARPTGWPAPSGPSARATPRSATPTRRSPAFLRDRLDLAVGALDRQVLDALRARTRSWTALRCPPG